MKDKLRKYVGNFEFYYETGMEGHMACIFHDDRGTTKGPSFSNETKKWDGPEMDFHSLAWSLWPNKYHLYKAIIFNKDGTVLYNGPLTFDKDKLRKSNFSVSFIPKEMEELDWLNVFNKELRGELYTNEFTSAEEQDYQITHKIGSLIYDDLTNTEVRLLNVSFGPNNTLGYWVDNDYLGGGRHPWEISAINFKKKDKK